MSIKSYKQIIGARTIKTGLATFLTAFICLAFDLNPIFAILTAIVTIEPTAKASLRKGIKRLPATVIGALLAVIFTYLLGDQSPFTYALSATMTVLICAHLNLHVGITVATLTSVAMIPGIHEAYVYNFLSRLVTAIIGLGTAGVVNFIVLPPKYYDQIESRIKKSERDMYKLYRRRMKEILLNRYYSSKSDQQLERLHAANTTIETLIGFQRDELSYHKNHKEDWLRLRKLTNRAHTNRLFITHLANIIYLPKQIEISFTMEERLAILQIARRVDEITQCGHFKREKKAASVLKNAVKALDEFDENQIKSHIIYEILLIYRILGERYNKHNQTMSRDKT